MSTETIKFNAEQAHEVGLPSPQALEYMMSVANMLLTSNLLGPDMEPTKDQTAAMVAAKCTQEQIDAYRDQVVKSNALAKMLIGKEMGIEPISALQDITIVKGKMFLHYSALIRQMEMKGYTCTWIERSNERAALKAARNGHDTLFEFTIEDAKRAGLATSYKDRYGNEANQYMLRPRVQLTARVASEAYRTTGGRANVYTPEERQEVLSARSTTDEPDGSDQQRAEVLAAQEEKYKVELKKPVPDGKTVEAMHATLQKTEEADKAVIKAAAESIPDAPAQFEIHVLMPTGADKPKPILLTGETQANEATAGLRGQALANDTGHDHIVVKFNPNTGERVQQKVCRAPAKVTAPAATAPQASAEAPAAAQEPATASQAPKTEPDAKGEAKARMVALAKALGIPEKTALARFSAYMAGFIGCPIKEFTSQPIEKRLEALSSLETTISADANEFSAGPEESGKRRRKWLDEVRAFLLEKWPKPSDLPTVELALELFQQWSQGPAQFKKWFELDSIALDFMPMEDAHAVLRVFLRTRDAADLLNIAKSHNLSVAKMVDQIETRAIMTTVEEAEVGSLENAIKAFISAVKEETRRPKPTPTENAKAQAAPVAPMREPGDEPEEDDNLFSGGSW